MRGRFLLGDKVLFDAVSLHASPGHWSCLLGTSGAGKSTLLRLLAGLPTGGRFEGEVVAARAAYMAQADLLAPWLDVRANVAFGARLRGERPDRARLDALLERVGLTDHAGKRPRELSGGMRQRAALARTLMEDRSVVLLDEPFSALDARTRAEMQELAFELLAGRTVVLVTHDPGDAVRVAHHAWLLHARGLEPLPLPGSMPLRDLGEPAVAVAAADLLARLRAHHAANAD